LNNKRRGLDVRGLLPAGIREFDAVSGSPILQFSGPWSKTFVMSFLAGQETTYGRESERWRRRRRRKRMSLSMRRAVPQRKNI